MARSKKPSTTSDLVRSLAVIIIPLVILAAFFTNLPRDNQVQTVDWQPVLAVAREQAPYPVVAPANLPEGWRATRVSWVEQGDPALNGDPSVRNTWQLGFLDPENTYVGLSQGDLEPEDFVADQTREGRADGTSTVGGRTYDRLISPDGRTRSLVQRDPAVTTVVTGDLSYEALEAYASTLTTG